eukprot:1561-Pelagococcus_subviridis.AAC.3
MNAIAVPSTASSPPSPSFRTLVANATRLSPTLVTSTSASTRSPTVTGARNVNVCDAYTAPGNRVPMTPPNIDATSIPCTTAPPANPAAAAAAPST